MLRLLMQDGAELTGQFSDTLQKALARARVFEDSIDAWFVDQNDAPVSMACWPIVAASFRNDINSDADDREATIRKDASVLLRLDPAFAQAEINSIRLLSYGDALQLTIDESTEFQKTLAPIAAAFDCELLWPVPSRAYLRFKSRDALPQFSATWDVLGDDLLEHFPGEGFSDQNARVWRQLITEFQMALHDHPINAGRVAARRTPVNLLWPWILTEENQGKLISAKMTSTLVSKDPEWQAIWRYANLPVAPIFGASDVKEGLLDLRDYKNRSMLERDQITPALARTDNMLELQFADHVYQIMPSNRVKFWRRNSLP